MIKRLLPEHETFSRLERVFSKMDEEGISFYLDNGEIIVRSAGYPDVRIYDLERAFGGFRGCGIYEIPPELEFKLLRDDS